MGEYGARVRAEAEVITPDHGMGAVMLVCGKCERLQQWMLPHGTTDAALVRVRCYRCNRSGLRPSFAAVTT